MARKVNKIIVLVGPSCSGKSTWAEEHCRKNEKTYIVSRDTERIALFGEYRMGDNKEEKIITHMVYEKVSRLLENKCNVILDNTHLKMSYINDIVKRFNYAADIHIKHFEDYTLRQLDIRNFNRGVATGKKIPTKVIKRQVNMHQSMMKQDYYAIIFYPKKNEGVKCNNMSQPIFFPGTEIEVKNLYVCDIDGTLSSSEHRDIYGATDEEIARDRVITPVQRIVQVLMLDPEITVMFLSGRSDKYIEATRKWLSKNITMGLKFELHMRKEGDYRPDTVVKKEMYERYVAGKFNVLGMIDDRKCMVELWQSMGIYTIDVGQGKNYF